MVNLSNSCFYKISIFADQFLFIDFLLYIFLTLVQLKIILAFNVVKLSNFFFKKISFFAYKFLFTNYRCIYISYTSLVENLIEFNVVKLSNFCFYRISNFACQFPLSFLYLQISKLYLLKVHTCVLLLRRHPRVDTRASSETYD